MKGNTFLKKKTIQVKVFERNSLLKAIEKIKEIRTSCDRMATEPDEPKERREMLKELSSNYTTAIEAMEAILYDL